MSRQYHRPRLVEITPDANGEPAWLRWRGRRERVRVHNAWRVEGAWWQPPSEAQVPSSSPGVAGASSPTKILDQQAGRAYFTVTTASRSALTIFHDEADGRWYLEGVLD